MLRQDRDRFVAFSFAAADALIEIDRSGTILFAAGALRGTLGRGTDALIGAGLFELLPLAERVRLRDALDELRRNGRSRPIVLTLAEQRLTLSGAMIPDRPDHAYLTLRAEPPGGVPYKSPPDQLLNRAAFNRMAQEAVRPSADGGDGLEMSLLSTEGLKDLSTRLDPSRAAALQGEIATAIGRLAGASEAAAQLDTERFGFIHQAGPDITALSQEIEAIGRRCDPTGRGISAKSATLQLDADPGSEAECAQALLYAINSFAEGRSDVTLSDLTSGSKSLLGNTVRRMAAFRSVIVGRGFTVAFQPIVALKDRQIHHHEALARFDARESPFDSIRFAEKVGLISEFDLAMVEKVLGRMAREDLDGRQISAAINVSGRSLDTPEFLDRLFAILGSYYNMRGRVLFELTESAEIRDLQQAAKAIDRLRQGGYPVCLDDFGSGASAFHYLHALHVDYVKIDGAFVRNVLAQARDRAFLAAMVQLCHDLGIATIGEMIETEETATYLAGIGVDYGQGYLFGRPETGWRNPR